MVLSPEILAVVLLGGLLCGFLNTVASSGSAVSLPILMWVGLHAVGANATNRIPVLVGAITATADLARHGTVPWKLALRAAVPITIGAAIGAMLSEIIPGHDLKMFITGAIVIALVLILTKLKDLLSSVCTEVTRLDWRALTLLFFVGVWTGFIVLDCATYMLLVLVLVVGLPLVEANAIKNFLLVPTTMVAMLVFAADQSINWPIGGAMAVGSVAGGYLGARLSLSEQARRWIVGLLVAVIVGGLIHLSLHFLAGLL